MVELLPSKQRTGVRFSLRAPIAKKSEYRDVLTFAFYDCLPNANEMSFIADNRCIWQVKSQVVLPMETDDTWMPCSLAWSSKYPKKSLRTSIDTMKTSSSTCFTSMTSWWYETVCSFVLFQRGVVLTRWCCGLLRASLDTEVSSWNGRKSSVSFCFGEEIEEIVLTNAISTTCMVREESFDILHMKHK